jgi:hypothetical protein
MFKQIIRRQNINNIRKHCFSDDNNNLTFLDKLNLESYMKSIQINTYSIRFWTILNTSVAIFSLFLNLKNKEKIEK